MGGSGRTPVAIVNKEQNLNDVTNDAGAHEVRGIYSVPWQAVIVFVVLSARAYVLISKVNTIKFEDLYPFNREGSLSAILGS